MKQQLIYTTAILTFVSVFGCFILVFSTTTTGLFFLMALGQDSDVARPAQVRIRTLAPLPPAAMAQRELPVEAAPVIEPARLSPVAAPLQPVQNEAAAQATVTIENVVETATESPPPAVNAPTNSVSAPPPVAAPVDMVEAVTVAEEPVTTVVVDEPLAEEMAAAEPLPEVVTEPESLAPVQPQPQPTPLFDPSSPPDTSFFDGLLEQVKQ